MRRLTSRTTMTSAVTIAAVLSLGACSQPAQHDGASSHAAAPASTVAATGTPARMRLVTGQQYANTIAYLFGEDIKVGAPFAPLQRTDGLLSSGAAFAGVTSGQMQQFQRAASAIAAQVVDAGNIERRLPAHRDFLVPCKPASATGADDACAAKFIASDGRLLFREPLSKEKLTELVGQAHAAADSLKDFYAGLSSVLEGMLVDPQVLMVTDTTEPDPRHPGHMRLDSYALAARLSYFLWNAAPDDAVLKAAEKGELYTPQGRAKVVDMMLASPRLEAGVRAFFDDMFGFDDFDNLAKDPAVYPAITGATLLDAREQTLRTVVDHLLVKKRDYRDLFTTRDTFMSPNLAPVYQIPVTPGWTAYRFPDNSPRVGLLTQVSFLAVHAHPARSSATKRGKALRELLLCQKVPSPPPNVDFSIVEDPKANFHTARERLTAHRANPVCAGCHRITDPMGLALENFDGAGQYRETEKGAQIDASGSLDGADFKDVAGLEMALHDHPSLPQCLVRRVYSYGVGGPTTSADDANLAAFNAVFAKAGYRLPDLLRAIVLSDAFSEVADAPPAVKTAQAATATTNTK